VRSQDIRQHKIHPEWAEIPAATAERIRAAKQRGRQVIAVGTTVVRTLEGAAIRNRNMGETGASFYAEDLVILPGHRFRVVEGLITNFHLPKSSLMMLVAAMVGRERLLKAYDFALKEGFRFYSYGDAMFIPKAEHGG
jgi:S-adenosylmethionine:tRNA ribosyltransferase-isomerase